MKLEAFKYEFYVTENYERQKCKEQNFGSIGNLKL